MALQQELALHHCLLGVRHLSFTDPPLALIQIKTGGAGMRLF
jgi:hypothetical protein